MPVLARLVNVYPVNQFAPKIYKHENNISPETKKNICLFLTAVESNDIKTVERLLDSGLDVDVEGERNETALTTAVVAGNVEMCRFLIRCGCDLNKSGTVPPFYFRVTPLCQSVISGKREITQLLLQSGCYKDLRDDMGRSALFYSLASDNQDILKLLLASGCDVNLGAKHTNCTLLHEAVAKGKLSLVKILLEAGADPNSYEINQRQTAGFFSTRKDIHVELVRYGSNINHTSRHGDTLLHNAISHGDLPLVEFFLEKGAILDATKTNWVYSSNNVLQQVTFQDPLRQAATDRYFDICIRLVQHGCSIDFIYREENDLLTRLLNSENTELIVVLLFAVGNSNWLKPVLLRGRSHSNPVNISSRTRSWLWELSGQVVPLRMMACHVIRQQIKMKLNGGSIFNQVQKLALPEIIQDCIMIKLKSD